LPKQDIVLFSEKSFIKELRYYFSQFSVIIPGLRKNTKSYFMIIIIQDNLLKPSGITLECPVLNRKWGAYVFGINQILNALKGHPGAFLRVLVKLSFLYLSRLVS